MRKFVVSSTLERADWTNSTIIRDNVVEEVSRLKQQPGGDILVAGSAQLVQTLMQHGLVDEYRLMLFPVVLGAGKRLFSDGLASTKLEVVEARPSAAVVLITLRPAPQAKVASSSH